MSLGDASTTRLPLAGGAETRTPAAVDGAAPPAQVVVDGEPAPKSNPARKVAIVILGAFVGIMGFHVLADLYAPSGSTGSVVASTTLVAPRVAGEIRDIFVSDNQLVAKGDPLFALDPRPFELTVRQAEANLANSVQAVDGSAASLEALRAKVAQAENTLAAAETSHVRAQSLFDRGVSSRSALEGSENQLAAARTGVDAARAELLSNETRVGEAGAGNPQIQAAQVQLDQAKLNLQFATVVAPSDGVITNLKLAVGQFVNVGAPALTFIESEAPWITIDLRENQLANLDVGDKASIVFDAVPGRTFKGEVRGIAWGIDPGRTSANGLPQNQATTRWFEPSRSIPVQLTLAEGEEWPRHVRVGSKANAIVFTGDEPNPVGWLAGGIQTFQSYLSYLF